jgi:ankyrin repeat protein
VLISQVLKESSGTDLKRLKEHLEIYDIDAIEPENGDTLLSQAILSEECKGVVRFLLDNGADPNKADYEGITPAMWASAVASSECLSIILEEKYKTKINQKDRDDGYTELHHAIRGFAEGMMIREIESSEGIKYVNIVKLLIEKGADVLEKDKYENTPSKLANDMLSDRSAEDIVRDLFRGAPKDRKLKTSSLHIQMILTLLNDAESKQRGAAPQKVSVQKQRSRLR